MTALGKTTGVILSDGSVVGPGNPLPISGGSGSNASVGPTGQTAPTSATELGGIDGSGNLQALQVDASKNLKNALASNIISETTYTASANGVVATVDVSAAAWISLDMSGTFNAELDWYVAGSVANQNAFNSLLLYSAQRGALKANQTVPDTLTGPVGARYLIIRVRNYVSGTINIVLDQFPQAMVPPVIYTQILDTYGRSIQTGQLADGGSVSVVLSSGGTSVDGTTTAPNYGVPISGKSNDGTPQYRILPLGASGRSVIVEGVAGGTTIPVTEANSAAILAALDDGQETMAGSLSVVQASDYPGIPVVDGTKATYSASVAALAVAGAPTDIFTLTGSNTKTVRILKVLVDGTSNTSNNVPVSLIKRSTADTAGTSSSVTAVPHDSNDAAASAGATSYTANPTLGTTVGTIASKELFIPGGNAQVGAEFFFGDRPGKAIVLRGNTQQICVNLGGTSITSGKINITIEWTEE